MNKDELDRQIAKNEKRISEARMQTDLAMLKLKRLGMSLKQSSSSKECLNLDARIKELEAEDISCDE